MLLFRPKGAEDCECRHFGYVFRAPSGEGGRQVTSENVQGSHGRVLMARAPSGEGGRLAAKPQMGRGLGTAETNLGQGSHGPGGMQCNVQLRSLIAFFNCLKGGHCRQFFFAFWDRCYKVVDFH